MISVVIPTYKNREVFIRNLKHNLPFLKGCEVIVVNDDPSDSISETMKHFPGVVLIENKINLGFPGAADTGIRSATKPYVMLLNSDVLLLDDSYKKAVPKLKEDDRLFTVSFAQKEKDGAIVGKNRMYWNRGFLSHAKAHDLKTGETGWAEGGSCMLNKKIYEALGGFDYIYAPYYWEDIDLSYRAWKEGYRVEFERGILVEHHHESTIGKYFNQNKIRTVAYRNQFLFIWKNITDKRLINTHIAHVIKSFLPMVFKDIAYIRGLFLALSKIVEVTEKRRLTARILTDKEIISKFNTQ